MKIFFTADMHLGHANIITYCERPFRDLEHMNRTLVRNWNARVGKNDVVFHVGDFCFRNSTHGKAGEGTQLKASDYQAALNGQIIFIRGNHDNNNSMRTCIDRITITTGGYTVALVHDPEMVDDRYDLNFVGHVHNLWTMKTFKRGMGRLVTCVNVGVDVHKFMPITFEEAIKCTRTKTEY